MARRLASPMLALARIVKQKDAEHAGLAALLSMSMARLKVSRAAGLAPVARAAGSGKSGLTHNTPPQGVLRRAKAKRASSHTPNRNPKVSHSANAALIINNNNTK
jgi:hypothetical protein